MSKKKQKLNTPKHLKFRGHKDKDIFNDVFENDCYGLTQWSPPQTYRLPKFIVDIGANIGSFGCLAAELYPNTTILSFEMADSNIKELTEHLIPYKNTKAIHKAVIGDSQLLGYRYPPSNPGGHKCMFESNETYLGSGRVPWPDSDITEPGKAITLKEVFAEYNIDTIDFLKLDCEGAEYEILFHAANHNLLKKIDTIAMEVHGLDNEKQVNKLKSIIQENYTTYTMRGQIWHASMPRK